MTLDKCHHDWRKQGYATFRKASDNDANYKVNFDADAVFADGFIRGSLKFS